MRQLTGFFRGLSAVGRSECGFLCMPSGLLTQPGIARLRFLGIRRCHRRSTRWFKAAGDCKKQPLKEFEDHIVFSASIRGWRHLLR